jgi:hypothetical protein
LPYGYVDVCHSTVFKLARTFLDCAFILCLDFSQVEKLAQGLEPTDNEDHADPAANAGADSGGVVGKPKGSSWAGGGGVHAGDTGKKGEGEALRAQPASSSGHATSAFPHAGMAQLGTGPTSRIQPAQVGAPYPKGTATPRFSGKMQVRPAESPRPRVATCMQLDVAEITQRFRTLSRHDML